MVEMNVWQLVSQQRWVTLLASWGPAQGSNTGSDPTLLNENDNKGTRRAAMARFVLPLSLCSPNSFLTKDIVIPSLITRAEELFVHVSLLRSHPQK